MKNHWFLSTKIISSTTSLKPEHTMQISPCSQQIRKKLHTAYIRKCLSAFKDNSSVIQLVSAEYTGPLHFVQFWLNVIKDWEKETGKKELIGLSTTKDVQDAILADPQREGIVDVI